MKFFDLRPVLKYYTYEGVTVERNLMENLAYS